MDENVLRTMRKNVLLLLVVTVILIVAVVFEYLQIRRLNARIDGLHEGTVAVVNRDTDAANANTKTVHEDMQTLANRTRALESRVANLEKSPK
jgi:uncharacterized phage infection (PIP) family protein YhgE